MPKKKLPRRRFLASQYGMNGMMLWKKRCWQFLGLNINMGSYSFTFCERLFGHNNLYAEFLSLVKETLSSDILDAAFGDSSQI